MTEPTRPPFKVCGTASIKHLNVRKEGPEDEKIIALDVKMEIKGIDRRLCAYFDTALEAFLWRGDTNALIVRNDFLAPIQYGHEITGATVKIASKTFMGCDVKKFAVLPRDGGVMSLTLSVSLYPFSSDVSDLANLVQEDATVEIEGPPDLFADAGHGAGARDGNFILTLGGNAEGPTVYTDSEPDPLLEQARELVIKSGKPSISYVQRQLVIGYNRAARLLEDLEALGVVSPMKSSGLRDVLVESAAV